MEAPIFVKELEVFELIEYSYLVREAAATDLTTFMTALFAFLVTAYFAGERLSSFQLVIVLFVYSLFSLATIQSLYTQLALLDMLSIELGLNETLELNYTIQMFISLITFAWLLSIGFLVEIRIKSSKSGAT